MKITTKITVTIERPDGSASEISQTRRSDAGDNPGFERVEVLKAVDASVQTFTDRHSLENSKLPLLP